MSSAKNSAVKNYFHKNGRAMGSMGYFILLMIVFLIGAPEAWIRPNLHQSVFVMMPTLLFMVIPLVFLVTSGEMQIHLMQSQKSQKSTKTAILAKNLKSCRMADIGRNDDIWLEMDP